MNLVAVAVADYIGVVILIAMLYSSHIRRSEGRFEYKIFSLIAGLSAFACAIDFLTFYVDGKPGQLSRIIGYAGNTYCFMTNPLFSIGWMSGGTMLRSSAPSPIMSASRRPTTSSEA